MVLFGAADLLSLDDNMRYVLAVELLQPQDVIALYGASRDCTCIKQLLPAMNFAISRFLRSGVDRHHTLKLVP